MSELVAPQREGWWMRESDTKAHRLTTGQSGALTDPWVSMCGLVDRGWRKVAACASLCCADCVTEPASA